MGIPELTAGDLVALRDGEPTRVGVDIALGRDTRAQRELLEARLLALAFTMTGKATTSQAPPEPETLEAYVGGALTGERLAAFERSVRGDPRAFAALVAFKDAYFGLGRKRTSSWSPPPSRRQVLGRLTVRSYGGRVGLSWDGDERGFSGFDRPGLVKRGLRVLPAARESRVLRDDAARERFKRRDMQRRQLEDLLKSLEQALSLNASLESQLQSLRTDMFMAIKTGSPEVLARLQSAVRELADRTERTQNTLRRLESQIGEAARPAEPQPMAFFDAEPEPPEVEIPTAAADLWFSADPRREGGLALRIQPTSREAAEFTWIRPGVDFELLAPAPGRALPLGVIDGEAMLLISRPGAPSQVIRVRAEGMRPA
jgi:chaperonin cofactor prefoldin